MKQHKNIPSKVADILRRTGRKKCLKKAELLTNSEHKSSSLNLRNLDLLPTEVIEIALVLKEIGSSGNSKIDSISFSYNSSLKDESAITLIKSLPVSIHELGLVNCGIGETGGQELLSWIKKAPNLKMICAELNSFSDKLKNDFRKFSDQNPRIIVMV